MSEAMHYLEDMIQNEPGAFRRPTRAEAQPLSLQEKRHRRSRLRQRLKQEAGGLREFWELAALIGLPRPTDDTEPEAKAAWIRGKAAHLALTGAQIEVAEIASAAFADGVDEVEELTGQPVDAWDSRCEVARQVLASADYPSEGSFALQFDQLLHWFTEGCCFFDQSYDDWGLLDEEDDDEPLPEGPLPPLVNPVLGRKTQVENENDYPVRKSAKRFYAGDEIQNMPRNPREAVLGSFLTKRLVSTGVGPGGVGKSQYSIAAAVAVAAGLPWDGDVPPEPMPVIIINNEDDLAENGRRMRAAVAAAGADWDAVASNIHVADASRPFVLAERSGAGVRAGKDVEVLVDEIIRTNAGLVIIDPAIEVLHVNENDNVEVKQALTILRDIARKTNCAILVLHHSGKEGARGLNAARGASSLGGFVRGYRTITEVDEKDAAAEAIPSELVGSIVRVDDVKLSYGEKRRTPSYFLRTSFEVDGEKVAALVPWVPEEGAN